MTKIQTGTYLGADRADRYWRLNAELTTDGDRVIGFALRLQQERPTGEWKTIKRRSRTAAGPDDDLTQAYDDACAELQGEFEKILAEQTWVI